MARSILFLFLFIPVSQSLTAQKTALYSEINAHYKEGLRLFQEGVYSGAKKEFQQVLEDQRLSFEPEYQTLRTYSEYYSAISSLRLKLDEADLMVTEFIKKHRPDPIAEKANLEVANYYFDQKNYERALAFYKIMDTRGLPNESLSEIKFKQGYSHFAKKDFKNAALALKPVSSLKTEYYFPVNYYLGMSQYFLAQYDESIKSLDVASKSKKYADLIPYYITYIYFSQGKYDQLLSYTRTFLDGTQKVDRLNLIRRMVGHAYFIKKDYASAIRYLEEFEKTNQSLEEADYYALGYSNYHLGHYSKAIPYFTTISSQQSQLGQNSNYYLADCYLRSGDRLSARTAFYNVSKVQYQEDIREEASFNYGKLSAELGYDREGLTTLDNFPTTSRYYSQAQDIMADILQRTKNYEQALRTIDQIKNPSARLKQAYQVMAYNRGLQLLQEDRLEEARPFFQKAIEPSFDKNIQLSATYWQADLAHRQKNYDQSIQWADRFLNQAGSGSALKDPAMVPMARYLQGYNYLKKGNFLTAGEQFKQSITLLNQKSTGADPGLLPDALLRAADCAFKRNNYDEAINGYAQVIRNKYAGNDYAQYQTALLQGLKGNSREKIRLLDELPKKQPLSKYADESLYELGVTYTDQSQMDEANTVLKKLIRDYPGSNIYNRALIQLGLVNYNLGQKNEALTHYKNVFKHNPSASESQEALAAIQEIYVDDLGQADEYIRFIESVPGYNLTNYSRDSLNYTVALRYFEDGQYERATTAFTDYLQKFPNGVNSMAALFRRAESYTLLKKYAPALQDYEGVIQRGRNEYYDRTLFKAASLAYHHAQDFNKAFKYYSELARAGTADESTLYEAQLGAMRSAYRTGQTQEVVQYGEKVAGNPQANDEQKSTASFYLGKIAYDQKNFPKATGLLTTVTRLSDNIQAAEARYLLANILFLQKQTTQAEEAVKQAIQQNADHPLWVAHCLILLSDIFVEKNDLFNARAALEAVLENYKEDPSISRITQEKLDAVNKKQQNSSKLKTDSLRSNSLFENN